MATYLYREKRVGNLAVRATRSASPVTLLFVPNDGGDDTAGVGDTTIRPAARAASQPRRRLWLNIFSRLNIFNILVCFGKDWF